MQQQYGISLVSGIQRRYLQQFHRSVDFIFLHPCRDAQCQSFISSGIPFRSIGDLSGIVFIEIAVSDHLCVNYIVFCQIFIKILTESISVFIGIAIEIFLQLFV